MIYNFEDIAFRQQKEKGKQLSEIYRGADMSDWWGGIQRVLKQKMDEYGQKEGKEREMRELATFKQIWDANPIGGSVSKNTLRLLASTANQAAAHEDVDCADFFGRLRDSLNRVIASKEELPAIPSFTGRDTGGSAKHLPKGNFAAQKEPPTPSGLNKPDEKPGDKKPGAKPPTLEPAKTPPGVTPPA